MPEGPEIRLAADRVANAIVGKRASEVFFGLPRLEVYAEELTGRTVRRVETHGKAMLTVFSGSWYVYSHNQLYGRWYVRKAHDLPKTGRSLRFAVHTRAASALLYSASEIEVLRRDELGQHAFLSRLGPDPLHEATTPAAVTARALADGFRRRSFGALLLDQSFVAGIGNYLRSEILWFARLHPARRPTDCAPEELAALGHYTVEITRRSYATRGITNDLDRADELKSAGEPRRRFRHAVFGLDGRPCPRCGEIIERTTIGSRRVYLCPGCQEPAR